jgi:hypothetical protein
MTDIPEQEITGTIHASREITIDDLRDGLKLGHLKALVAAVTEKNFNDHSLVLVTGLDHVHFLDGKKPIQIVGELTVREE